MSPHASQEIKYVSDKLKVKLGAVAALSVCVSIATGTWVVSGAIHKFQEDLKDQFREIQDGQSKIAAQVAAAKANLLYKWATGQQAVWANALEKANRDLKRETGPSGLIVPDPLTIRTPSGSTQLDP